MMWFVFDQLWGASAASDMKRAFLSAVRLLAQFAREPTSNDYSVAAGRSYSLREAINNSFDGMRSSADGVLLNLDLLASKTLHGAPSTDSGNRSCGSFS